jgi:hypothetical protein
MLYDYFTHYIKYFVYLFGTVKNMHYICAVK